MKHDIVIAIQEAVQAISHSKPALGIGVALASSPTWIDLITGEGMRAVIIVIGVVVSFTVIGVNIQTFLSRRKQDKIKEHQEQLRTFLLEEQVKDRKKQSRGKWTGSE